MKFRTIAAVAMAAGLTLAACGSDDKSDSTNAPATTAAAATTAASATTAAGSSASTAAATTVASGGSAPAGDSATLAKAKSRGHLIIGVKEDQPNLGYKDPTTGEYSGFDIEIARLLAKGLGFEVDGIEYKAIPSANREDEISAGNIDYYVGTYSITDTRKQRISFAGPYFIAGQDLLVRKDDDSIVGPNSLKDKTTCSVTGSTSLKRIKEEYGGNTIELEKYSLCVDQLLDKQVDAVTTDDAILKGYAALDPDNLRVVGKPFSEERYGIGIPKGDVAMCESINELLETARTNNTWQEIYDSTLGRSGATATQPETDPCS
jgi:glutamate transport system substrate-binding protein